MRYCRFPLDGIKRYGLVEDRHGAEFITRAVENAPNSANAFDSAQPLDIPLGEVHLLAPVQPSKIVCIGRNYREHAKELNHPIPTEPLIFLKPPSSVIGPGDQIRRPNHLSQRAECLFLE